jgi:hypothetical protein
MYWEKRSHLIYYRYIEQIVRGLASNAMSMIDVGSYKTPNLELFDWIPIRHSLDIAQPYQSATVKGIKADFLSFQPERTYDISICLQVLEHIPDAARFAMKLFEVSAAVLISVPYKWPAGSHKDHVHDPVDLDKLVSWIGRMPDYHLVVTEPLNLSPKARRLIAYFHPPGKALDLSKARRRLART